MRFNTQSRKLFRQMHMNKPMNLPDINVLSEKYEDILEAYNKKVSFNGYKIFKIIKDKYNFKKEWHIFKDGDRFAWMQIVSGKITGKEKVDKAHIEKTLDIKL